MEADEWQEDWSFFVTALYKVTEKNTFTRPAVVERANK